MAILWLSASVLVLGVLAILIPVLLRARESRALARNDVNVAIAREREKELRRDLQEGLISDADYDSARGELEQGLALDLGDGTAPPVRPAGSPIVAVAISALLPVFALGLYLALGTPDAPNLERASQEAAANATTQPDVATMLAEMRLRLEDRPDDVRGWRLYANALMGTGRYNEAVPAYRRLKALQPDNPEVVVRLADAIAMTQGGVLGGEPESLISEALQLQPNHPQGLWLFGIAKEQVVAGEAPVGTPFRLGGMVVDGSVIRGAENLNIRFDLTDTAQSVSVTYTGILPDLFREGQGIVAQGSIDASGQFTATEVLAKHDETYMPPEVADALEKAKAMGLQ